VGRLTIDVASQATAKGLSNKLMEVLVL